MLDELGETKPMLADDMATTCERSNMSEVTPKILINRPAYTQNAMVSAFNLRWQEELKMKERMKKCVEDQLACTAECWKERVFRFLPFINIMRNYQWREWLLLDFISGLSVGVIHIPQGMAFALLTAVPPAYGLYSSFFPVLIYFFFGTSRHLSMGTMALISLMIGTVVNREAEKYGGSFPMEAQNDTMILNDTATIHEHLTDVKIGLALSVSLLIGIFQFVMGMVGLGAVATFMSMPFIGSFLTAAAVHIITSQVPAMLGITIRGHTGIFKVPLTWYDIFDHITDTNICALITSLASLLILVVLKEVINERFKSRMKVPIPAELIVVIIATIASHYAHLHDAYNLKIVGSIPVGIPAPRVPPLSNAFSYLADTLVISIISFAISISMAKLMAKKHDYSIDVNQELFASGLCYGISAFFNSFAGAQAPPRTLVHESIGGKTQVSSLFSCGMVLIVCLFLGQLFYALPIPALAAIVIVALLSLFRQFNQLPTLWRVNRYDFLVWVVTFLAVVILDVITGLVVGMGTSIFLVVFQAHFASGSALVSVIDSDVYLTKDMYLTKDRLLSDNVFEHPGILAFHFNAPLFFVNVEKFKLQLYAKVVTYQNITEPPTSSAFHMPTMENGVFTNNIQHAGIESTAMSECIPEQNNDEDLSGSAQVQVDDKSSRHSNLSGDQRGLHAIILDCAAISYIDIMGVNMLNAIRTDLQKLHITFSLACVPSDMSKKLEAAGSITLPDDEKTTEIFTVYPTVQDAVAMETRSIQ